MNWSSYQLSIFEAVRETTDSLVIEAVAGSGKTSTIVEAIKYVPQAKSVVFLAFNRAIQQTLASRVTAPNAQCLTLHAMGLRAWRRFIGSEAGARLQVKSDKTFQIIRDVVSWEDRRRYPAIARAVALGKQAGIVPKGCRLSGRFISLTGFESDERPISQIRAITCHSERLADRQAAPEAQIASGLSLSDLPEDEPTTDHVDCKGLIEDTDDNWFGLLEEYDVDSDDVRLNLVRKVLRESIVRSPEVIDFDDMLLMPVAAGSRFDKYDVVFVDEWQDTSSIQHEMIERMLGEGSRLVCVGDGAQQIYRWRGGMDNCMEVAQQRFGCRPLPLSISYRCPRAVVRQAQKWVRTIEFAPEAIEGVVVEYPEHSESCPEGDSHANRQSVVGYGLSSGLLDGPTESCVMAKEAEVTCTCGGLRGGWLMKDFRSTDVLLCRLTRPLVEVAFRLIRARIPCRVLGRDIGQGLVRLIDKSKLGDSATVRSFMEWLESYEKREKEKLRIKEEWGKIGLLDDKLQTLRVFMDDLDLTDSISRLKQEIEGLFRDDNGAGKILLSTIHRFKGQEAPRVFVLDADTLQPIPWSKDEAGEIHLMYVAATRAMSELYYIRSAKIR